MLITNSIAPKAARKARNSGTSGPQPAVKQFINSAAYTTGGALGGLALGAISGKVMSYSLNNPALTAYGGGIGALGGAAASLAVSLSDEPISLGRTFGAWAGSAVGATVGMHLVGGFGGVLAAHGASSLLGTHGVLLGALAGGLGGGRVGFIGDYESSAGNVARATSSAAMGAATGILAGGLVQTMLAAGGPELSAIAASAPIAGAAALGALGLQNSVNPGWSYGHKAKSSGVQKVAMTTMGAGAGYLVGSIGGGIVSSISGSPAFSVLGPAVGAAVGAGMGLGQVTNKDGVTGTAIAAGLAGAGSLGGHLAGYGLSVLTGQSGFALAGSIAGAVAGGTMYLDSRGQAGRYGLPVAAGLSLGMATGAAVGAGLTALTGEPIFQNIGTALGVASGLCAGLAAGVNRKNPSQGWDFAGGEPTGGA